MLRYEAQLRSMRVLENDVADKSSSFFWRGFSPTPHKLNRQECFPENSPKH